MELNAAWKLSYGDNSCILPPWTFAILRSTLLLSSRVHLVREKALGTAPPTPLKGWRSVCRAKLEFRVNQTHGGVSPGSVSGPVHGSGNSCGNPTFPFSILLTFGSGLASVTRCLYSGNLSQSVFLSGTHVHAHTQAHKHLPLPEPSP